MPDAAAPGRARETPRWPERVALGDGSEIIVRPIRRTDKARLKEGFDRLSPESRYRRFLVPMTDLTPALVRYLTEVDHRNHEALVALGADSGEPIGVARYVRSEDEADVAEVAVAVVDHWHRRGVATELLRRLAERAHEEGIARFTATCLADNDVALDLFSELGSRRGVSRSGLVEAQIELPAVDEPRLLDVLRAAAAQHLVFRPRWTRLGGEADD